MQSNTITSSPKPIPPTQLCLNDVNRCQPCLSIIEESALPDKPIACMRFAKDAFIYKYLPAKELVKCALDNDGNVAQVWRKDLEAGLEFTRAVLLLDDGRVVMRDEEDTHIFSETPKVIGDDLKLNESTRELLHTLYDQNNNGNNDEDSNSNESIRDTRPHKRLYRHTRHRFADTPRPTLCGVVGNNLLYCREDNNKGGTFKLELYDSDVHEYLETLPQKLCQDVQVSACSIPDTASLHGWFAVLGLNNDDKIWTLNIYIRNDRTVTTVWKYTAQLVEPPLPCNAMAAVGSWIFVASRNSLRAYTWTGALVKTWKWDDPELPINGEVSGLGCVGGRLVVGQSTDAIVTVIRVSNMSRPDSVR